MVYLATFSIKINQMQVYIPYMDPMGLGRFPILHLTPLRHLVISQVGTLTHMSPEVLDRKCPPVLNEPGDAKQEPGWWWVGGFETWGNKRILVGIWSVCQGTRWVLFVGFVVFCLRCWEILYLYCYPCCVFCWEDIKRVSLTFRHYHEHLHV